MPRRIVHSRLLAAIEVFLPASIYRHTIVLAIDAEKPDNDARAAGKSWRCGLNPRLMALARPSNPEKSATPALMKSEAGRSDDHGLGPLFAHVHVDYHLML